jgi:hypothetical protein
MVSPTAVYGRSNDAAVSAACIQRVADLLARPPKIGVVQGRRLEIVIRVKGFAIGIAPCSYFSLYGFWPADSCFDAPAGLPDDASALSLGSHTP